MQGNHDMSALTEHSKPDNVLLEWDMALELFELGRVRAVHPIFVGDEGQVHSQHDRQVVSASSVYMNYHATGCRQHGTSVVVKSSQEKAMGYIHSAGVDLHAEGPQRRSAIGIDKVPTLLQGRTVEQIIFGIHKFQVGFYVEGSGVRGFRM